MTTTPQRRSVLPPAAQREQPPVSEASLVAVAARNGFAANVNPVPISAPPKEDAAQRQQIGVRVLKTTYRQLKAEAALSGGTVQGLIEQAIVEFLSKITR